MLLERSSRDESGFCCLMSRSIGWMSANKQQIKVLKALAGHRSTNPRNFNGTELNKSLSMFWKCYPLALAVTGPCLGGGSGWIWLLGVAPCLLLADEDFYLELQHQTIRSYNIWTSDSQPGCQSPRGCLEGLSKVLWGAMQCFKGAVGSALCHLLLGRKLWPSWLQPAPYLLLSGRGVWPSRL